jgi:hypothetical protein
MRELRRCLGFMTISCTPTTISCYPFYRRLEFCILLNSGYLARVLIAEPCIRNAVRVMSAVIRGEQAFLSIACSKPFRFRVCGSDFKGSSCLESIFGLSRIHFQDSLESIDLEIKASTPRERRETEEVQRTRTGRTDRRRRGDHCAAETADALTNWRYEYNVYKK